MVIRTIIIACKTKIPNIIIENTTITITSTMVITIIITITKTGTEAMKTENIRITLIIRMEITLKGKEAEVGQGNIGMRGSKIKGRTGK